MRTYCADLNVSHVSTARTRRPSSAVANPRMGRSSEGADATSDPLLVRRRGRGAWREERGCEGRSALCPLTAQKRHRRLSRTTRSDRAPRHRSVHHSRGPARRRQARARLGALFALERLALNNPEHRHTITGLVPARGTPGSASSAGRLVPPGNSPRCRHLRRGDVRQHHFLQQHDIPWRRVMARLSAHGRRPVPQREWLRPALRAGHMRGQRTE